LLNNKNRLNMNPNHVLSKIMTMLSLEKEEVLFTYARLADGTILESATFDVGESVEVVAEDGKSPAPNGEHEIILKDTEGNEVRIKIFVTDGKITERENVELEDEAEVTVEEEVSMESIAGEDIGGEASGNEVTDETQPLTEDMGKVMEKLQYRIEEMEKKMQQMEEMFPKPNEEEVSDVKKAETVSMASVKEEDELPKLDGAPIEEAPKVKGNFGKKTVSSQGTFLSKLYN
jgi:hypothetical protein